MVERAEYQALVRRRDELLRQCRPDAAFIAELNKAPLAEQIFCLAVIVGMRNARPKPTFH